MYLLAQLIGFIKDDKDVRSAAVTCLGTSFVSGLSYLAGNYDRVLAASLSLAGLAFLLWRWRKASKALLCDRFGCPKRSNQEVPSLMGRRRK
jgi:hypothetical protein